MYKRFSPQLMLSATLLFSALVFLPACNPFDWFKSHQCTDCVTHAPEENPIDAALAHEVVVSLEGKPLVTGAEYEQCVELLMHSQPEFKDLMAFMNEEQKDQMCNNILESLATERLIVKWVKDQGVDQTPEYQENARRAHDAVDRDLAIRSFQAEVAKNISFTDDEARSWYTKNRERLMYQPFVTMLGGVKAQGFSVATEKEAKDLEGKAQKAGADFAKVAQDAKQKVTDFGLVNVQSSTVPMPVRRQLMGMKKVPTVEVIKEADNKWWIVKASSKQEPTFAEFEAVKPAVMERMKEERFMDLVTKKINELKEKYHITIHKEYLQKRKKAEKKPEETPQEVAQVPQVTQAA